MRSKRLLALIGSVSLALVLAVPLVVACAAPAEGPAPEVAMEPQKWDLTISGAATRFYDIELKQAVERIKERTGGLLDIRVVPSGGLPIKSEDWARAVSSGDLAMSGISGAYHAGEHPIWGLLDVPYLYTSFLEKRIVWEAVRPIFQREMEKANIYILSYYPRFIQGLATNEPVDVMDLKGKKIRSYAKHIAIIIEALGGVAVPVAWAEVYTAIQTGVVDGLLTGIDSSYHGSMYEVAPYMYDIGLIHGMWVIGVNKDLWDALPKDVQNIVHEEMAMFQGMSIVRQPEEVNKISNDWLAAGGKGYEKIVDPAFFALLREEAAKPVLEDRLAAAGAVGEEIVTAIEQALGITLG